MGSLPLPPPPPQPDSNMASNRPVRIFPADFIRKPLYSSFMKLIERTVCDNSNRISMLSTARIVQDFGRDMLAILRAVHAGMSSLG
jgi:hypothetical protein